MAEEVCQVDFLRQEIHGILRGRYKTLTIAETIGVLEMVKFELSCNLYRLAQKEEDAEDSL